MGALQGASQAASTVRLPYGVLERARGVAEHAVASRDATARNDREPP